MYNKTVERALEYLRILRDGHGGPAGSPCVATEFIDAELGRVPLMGAKQVWAESRELPVCAIHCAWFTMKALLAGGYVAYSVSKGHRLYYLTLKGMELLAYDGRPSLHPLNVGNKRATGLNLCIMAEKAYIAVNEAKMSGSVVSAYMCRTHRMSRARAHALFVWLCEAGMLERTRAHFEGKGGRHYVYTATEAGLAWLDDPKREHVLIEWVKKLGRPL